MGRSLILSLGNFGLTLSARCSPKWGSLGRQHFLGTWGKTCVSSGVVPAPVDLCHGCAFRSLRD